MYLSSSQVILGGSLIDHWWLVRVTLMVALAFCLKILGGGRDLRGILCHSITVWMPVQWWGYNEVLVGIYERYFVILWMKFQWWDAMRWWWHLTLPYAKEHVSRNKEPPSGISTIQYFLYWAIYKTECQLKYSNNTTKEYGRIIVAQKTSKPGHRPFMWRKSANFLKWLLWNCTMKVPQMRKLAVKFTSIANRNLSIIHLFTWALINCNLGRTYLSTASSISFHALYFPSEKCKCDKRRDQKKNITWNNMPVLATWLLKVVCSMVQLITSYTKFAICNRT